LVELLERAPVVARCIAAHHPWIICDEHQDAKRTQHRVVELVGAAGARVRFFADSMQAIFDFDEELLAWDDFRSSIQMEELDEAHRWHANRELGAWILKARTALRDGAPLPRPLPPTVTIERAADLKDQPNFKSRLPTPELGAPVRAAIAGKNGTIAILTSHRQHRFGLRAQVIGFQLFEGSDMTEAQEAVYAAEVASGSPQQLVIIAMDLLELACTGLPSLRSQVERACGASAITPGRGQKVQPLLDRFALLYADPTLKTWCRVVGGFLRPPPGMRVAMETSLRTVLRLGADVPSYQRFITQTGDTRGIHDLPTRAVYTIHASKGREFDHIVIAPCGAAAFPDDPGARRRLYLAISRARQSVHIIVPGDHPSPLLGLGGNA
jgi:DNA helicase-2/ATP-dependent DNA helicase PcrA